MTPGSFDGPLPDDADVLVLGAGLAGLYLALMLAPRRRCVVVAPQGPGEGGSSGWAQGGVAAALGPDDSPELHAQDTIAVGGGLVDPTVARILAEEGPDRVRHLETILDRHSEVGFDRTPEGRFHLSLEAAHSRARVARVTGDQAGKTITSAVARAARAQPGVTLRAGWTADALIPGQDGPVLGAAFRDRVGRRGVVRARETVLAVGGVGGLYAVTTAPKTAQGWGLALGGAVGAVIADPEFVQFHPTALDVGLDPAPLATEALRGDGAVLVDAAGVALIDPLAPRDAVARAVHAARLDGRGAFLDARDAIGSTFPERFPTVFAACQRAGLDPRTTPLPVAPAAHYHMGGVATDTHGRTSVRGLWAVGEAAGAGAHGANRLASNSLLEAVVFARRAADALAETPTPPSEAPARAPAPPPTLSAEANTRLRNAMARDAGVVRNAPGLTRLLRAIDTLEAEAADHLTQSEPSASPLALVAARLIATAALNRRESRGAHWRSDFPHASASARATRCTLSDVNQRSTAASPPAPATP